MQITVFLLCKYRIHIYILNTYIQILLFFILYINVLLIYIIILYFLFQQLFFKLVLLYIFFTVQSIRPSTFVAATRQVTQIQYMQ